MYVYIYVYIYLYMYNYIYVYIYIIPLWTPSSLCRHRLGTLVPPSANADYFRSQLWISASVGRE